MLEAEVPERRENVQSVQEDRSQYDLAAEEREKRRQFFIGLPILVIAALAIGVLAAPLVGREYGFPAMSAAVTFVTILVTGILAVWERLTLRLAIRVLGAALLVALLAGAVALLIHQLGIFSVDDLVSSNHRPQN
jgi:hypothetical protein